MTVNARSPISGPYTTNGVNKSWNFTFKITDTAHMTVWIADPDGSNGELISSGISIAEQYVNNDAGGWLEYPANGQPIPAGKVLFAIRNVPYDQPSRIGNQGRYYPKMHENSYDYLEMQIQQLRMDLGRAWKAPYGQTGGTINKIPPGNIWVADEDGNAIDGGPKPTGGGGSGGVGDAALYQLGGNLKKIDFNGNIASGGGFPRSASAEVRDDYSGGNPDASLFNQAPSDPAHILFLPPTEESTNFVAPNVPWISIGGSPRRVIPLDIRTVVPSTLITPTLFRPTRTNGSGFLTWRYIGDKPIHGLLSGSLSVICLVSGTVPDAYQRLILGLEPFDGMNFIEQGQSAGRKWLASSIGSLGQSARFADTVEFNDPCFTITQALIDELASQPNLFTASLQGFFRSTTTGDALELADDLGPVGPEVRSTPWIDVSAIDFQTRSLMLHFTGVSTRGRIRYKLADGVARYFSQQSMDKSGRRVYRLPVGTQQVQIYYTGRGATVSDASVQLKAIGPNNSTGFDPVKGYFARKDFNVCREITLTPGTEYAMHIYTEVFDLALAREWGFRFQSGGFKLSFDAGHVRKQQSSKLFRSE